MVIELAARAMTNASRETGPPTAGTAVAISVMTSVAPAPQRIASTTEFVARPGRFDASDPPMLAFASWRLRPATSPVIVETVIKNATSPRACGPRARDMMRTFASDRTATATLVAYVKTALETIEGLRSGDGGRSSGSAPHTPSRSTAHEAGASDRGQPARGY